VVGRAVHEHDGGDKVLRHPLPRGLRKCYQAVRDLAFPQVSGRSPKSPRGGPRRQGKQPIAIHARLGDEIGQDREREIVPQLVIIRVGEDRDPDPQLRQPPQVSGFYEWFEIRQIGRSGRPLKQPFYLLPTDANQVLPLARLYEFRRDKDKQSDDPDAWLITFTITTNATDDVGHIHDRMPMTVRPEHWEAWLDPREQGRQHSE
jgi:hypothetical protein